MQKIRTVLGDIPPEKLGLTLTHEHIIANFRGGTYDPNEVFDVMLPYLKDIQRLGVTGFVHCTPPWYSPSQAKEARLLARLSEASGIHVLIPTGFGRKYTSEYPVDRMAHMWAREIEEGIGGTSIKAGFIKIMVPGYVTPIEEKIVRAAARCSLSTGATIVCHTIALVKYDGGGVAAMQVLNILDEAGVNPNKLIAAHIDLEENLNHHLEIARRGAWVEYENLREARAEKILKLIKFMVENGFEDQLLLSQDSGWYHVGEKGGGKIRGCAYLVRDFVPLMLERGFRQELIDKILIRNPARAFQVE